MARYCLVGQVHPDRLEAVRQLHARVWPELLEALSEAGWRNYSLFLCENGTLIGYVEADDFDTAQLRIQGTEINRRWQQVASELFVTEGAPDQAWDVVPEVFHLEAQLHPLRAHKLT